MSLSEIGSRPGPHAGPGCRMSSASVQSRTAPARFSSCYWGVWEHLSRFWETPRVPRCSLPLIMPSSLSSTWPPAVFSESRLRPGFRWEHVAAVLCGLWRFCVVTCGYSQASTGQPPQGSLPVSLRRGASAGAALCPNRIFP